MCSLRIATYCPGDILDRAWTHEQRETILGYERNLAARAYYNPEHVQNMVGR